MLETKMSFLNSVNHEIRTPLNSILGFSSLLQERNYEIEKVKELSKNINNSGNRLKFYLENLILMLELKDQLYRSAYSEIEFKTFLQDLIQSVNEHLNMQNDFGIELNYNSELLNTKIEGDKTLLIRFLSGVIIDYMLNNIEGNINISYNLKLLVSLKVKRIKKKIESFPCMIASTCTSDSFLKTMNSTIANHCFEVLHECVYIYSNLSGKQTNIEIQTRHK